MSLVLLHVCQMFSPPPPPPNIIINVMLAKIHAILALEVCPRSHGPCNSQAHVRCFQSRVKIMIKCSIFHRCSEKERTNPGRHISGNKTKLFFALDELWQRFIKRLVLMSIQHIPDTWCYATNHHFQKTWATLLNITSRIAMVIRTFCQETESVCN